MSGVCGCLQEVFAYETILYHSLEIHKDFCVSILSLVRHLITQLAPVVREDGSSGVVAYGRLTAIENIKQQH